MAHVEWKTNAEVHALVERSARALVARRIDSVATSQALRVQKLVLFELKGSGAVTNAVFQLTAGAEGHLRHRSWPQCAQAA